ncbi:MAG: alpha/beta fold hydrolase [Candidatus Binatia bacterium]
MTVPALGLGSEAPVSRRASIEFARTSDGWDLALHRYAGAPSQLARDRPPVVLCPGYACNRHFMDFDDRYSLARFLAGHGFDAWVLELRGHGYSEQTGVHRSKGWTFDDLVQYDVPAAVSYVRQRCAGRQLVWVGHSMGGMVMYATLGQDREVQQSIAGLVTMASPVAFPALASRMMRRLGGLFLLLPFPQHLPQHNVLVALWSLISWSPGATQVGMNPTNVDPRAFGQALRRCICNVPRSMLRQLAQWSLTGEFRSGDGRIDYRANLAGITTPVFTIAGAADRLAAPEMVRFAYDHVRSARKRYREFAARLGDSADYGHVDLIFGRRAPEEVFPAISAWIEEEVLGSGHDAVPVPDRS